VTPYYEDGALTIYHGDCREILPTLEPVGLLLADPPYGHGDRWSGGTWAADPMYAEAKVWDAAPVDLDLLTQAIALADTSIIWGGNYYALPPSRCWLAWDKASKMATMADFELAWTSRDAPSKSMRLGRNPDGKRSHPTQKPLALITWCIQWAGGEGAILDPFMGSGTTLRAAKNLGRRAIGIELSEKYCEIAATRMAQGVLF